MTDLEQLFNDAMAWGMVYGETLCASKCWHEERDKRAKMYAEQAKALLLIEQAIPTGKPVVITRNLDGSLKVQETVSLGDISVVVK